MFRVWLSSSAICVVGASLFFATGWLLGSSFKISDYLPPGGEPPVGGSTTSG